MGPKGEGEYARKGLTEKACTASPISGSFRSSESCLRGEEVRNTYSPAPRKLNAWNVTSSNIQVAPLGGLPQCPGQWRSPGWAAHSAGRRQCPTRLACSDLRGMRPSQHPQRGALAPGLQSSIAKAMIINESCYKMVLALSLLR